MDIYKTAARKKLRFDTDNGALSVEQLFGLRLTSNDSRLVTLDTIGRALLAEQKTFGSESLVSNSANPREATVALSIAILKDVIATKQEAADRAARKADKAAERTRLLDAMRNREEKDLSEASKDDLAARIAALDAEDADAEDD